MRREVIILGNHAGLNDLFNKIIPEFEYKPVFIGNGAEALESLEKKSPALVLLDLELPDVPGIEILKYFFAKKVNFPVIVVSANRDVNTVVKCFKYGVYDYILIPFNVARIKEAIADAIRRHHEEREANFYNNALEERVCLQQEWLEVANTKTDQVINDVLNSLVRIIGLKERGIREHSMRVRTYAVRLGEMFGLSYGQLRQLSYAAVLHDIGKINVPDEILNKNGPLTTDEWEVIMKHPAVGYEIFRKTEHFSEAAEIIYTHHERYDGSGYPRGLQRDSIPFLSRLFSVVDAYDAIVSDRPYSAAVDPESAMLEIGRNAGSQFDPVVVRSFMEISRNNNLAISLNRRAS
jgi:putative nucleotidyltransferase with HDIG domain